MALSKVENLGLQSFLAAGIFESVDKFYYGNPIDIKKAGLVAAAHASSAYVTDWLVPSVASNAVLNSADKVYVQPLVSGGIYSFASGQSALGWDYRSPLLKFILAAGSSAAANYVDQPVQKMLGM